jgi:uncharacterized protein (TIGR02466 family)
VTSAERQIHALFPTPLGSYQGFAYHDQLLALVLEQLEEAEAHQNGQDSNLSHYYDRSGAGFLDFQKPLIQELRSWILQCSLDFVCNALGLRCDELIIASSWLNRCAVGGSQAAHSHENSLVSGTYYLNFSQGHAPIQFWRPAAAAVANVPYLSLASDPAHQQNAFSAQQIQIAPSAGGLLLWPSHLLHGHSGNAAANRLTLSFNLLPRRLVGSSYSLEIIEPRRS